MNPQMVDVESVPQILDPTKAGVFRVWLRKNKMDINEVLANLVDRTESHLSEERHSRFYRIEIKAPNLAIFGKKVVEQANGFFAFPFQEVVDGVMATGM